jgi:ribosomal protein S9
MSRGAALKSLLVALIGALGLIASAGAAPALASAPHWYILTRTAPTNLAPGQEGIVVAQVANLGGASVQATQANPVKILDKLPQGIEATGQMTAEAGLGAQAVGGHGEAVIRSSTCKKLPELVCEYVGELPPYVAIEVRIPVRETAASSEQNVVEVSGANAPAKTEEAKRPAGDAGGFGVESFAFTPESESGATDSQAGSHPFQLTTTLALNEGFGRLQSENAGKNALPEAPELLRNLHTTLPAGLVANTNAVDRCSGLQFSQVEPGNFNNCPPDTAIGAAIVTYRDPAGESPSAQDGTQTVPIFNLETSPGEPARLGFSFEKVAVTLDAALKTGEGYAVEISSTNTSASVEVLSTIVTVWGTPGAASHDSARGWECIGDEEFLGKSDPRPCKPAAALEESDLPYLTLPTTCEQQNASIEVQSWKPGAQFLTPTYAPEQLENCAALPFSPSIKVTPFSEDASTPTGLKTVVEVPQASTLEPTESEGGVAEKTISSTSVTLPTGMLSSPGVANGLTACPVEDVGFEEGASLQSGLEGQHFTLSPEFPGAACERAKLGTVKIVSPMLKEPLSGSVYLATQDTDPFGSPLVLYLIAAEKEEGVYVKLAGAVNIGPTGQLTTVFSGTPPVPFEKLELTLANEENGERAATSTPPFCGAQTTEATFTPYSGTPVQSSSTFEITHGPGGSACPGSTLPFAPSSQAGSVNSQAGAFTPFTLTVGHADGQQALEKINLQLPPGLSALISQITPCSEAEAEAESCGPESLVGTSTSVSGLGGKPVTLEGKLYFTGPLKATSTHGASPFGLLDVTPVHVGPFVLNPVKVLSTITINETTAAASVSSEPIPQYVQGVPAQLKQLTVRVERPGGAPFQFNPTNCNELKVTGSLTGYEGASSAISQPFYVTNCSALPFKPKLTSTAAAQGSKVDGTALNVKIESPGLGQAGIAKVFLTIPKILPSRLTTIQKACVDAVFEKNPAECDEGSVIGKATIHTPVFKNPLSGPAYLVSHGNAAFPDVEFVLQGEGVTIVIDGKTDIKNGVTYSRFESSPDAPFTTFETNLPAGPHSALTVNTTEAATYNICSKAVNLPTVITAQDGAVIDQETKVAITGCGAVKASKVTKLSRAQELAKALKKCRTEFKHKKSKRASCEKQARKKYGPKKAKKSAKKSSKKKK